MALRIVAHDTWVLDRATEVQTILNSGNIVARLFSNNFAPAPGDVIAAFTQGTFAGYGPINTTGLFAAPVQIRAGEYSVLSSVLSWVSTDVGGEQIYGVYLTDPGNSVVHLSALLPTPVFMVDPVELQLRIDYRRGAMILY